MQLGRLGQWMSRWGAWAAVMIVVGFFLTKVDIALGMRKVLPADPSVIFVAASVMLLGYVLSNKSTAAHLSRVAVRCWPVLSAFLAVVVVSLLGSFRALSVVDEDYRPIFFPLFDFYIFIAGLAIGSLGISQAAKRLWLSVAFAISVGAIAIDIVYPNTFSISEYRAAGIAMNPNGGAFVVLLLMISLLKWGSRKIGVPEAIILSLGLFGVLVTLSRVGVMLYVIVATMYMLLNQSGLLRRAWVLLIGVAIVGGISMWAWSTLSDTDDVVTRFVATRFLVGNAAIGEQDDSLIARGSAMDQSMELIAEAPFLGNGTGASYRMDIGPHNMYLATWVDNGLLGVGSYVVLVVLLIKFNQQVGNIEGFVLSVVMLLFGFFSHNVLEDRTLLLLLAMSMASGTFCSSKRVLGRHSVRLNGYRGEASRVRWASGSKLGQ